MKYENLERKLDECVPNKSSSNVINVRKSLEAVES